MNPATERYDIPRMRKNLSDAQLAQLLDDRDRLILERDDIQRRFERLGATGEIYMKELRGTIRNKDVVLAAYRLEVGRLRQALVHIGAMSAGGLTTDGAHHKQEYLADIARAAGIQPETLRSLDVDVASFIQPEEPA